MEILFFENRKEPIKKTWPLSLLHVVSLFLYMTAAQKALYLKNRISTSNEKKFGRFTDLRTARIIEVLGLPLIATNRVLETTKKKFNSLSFPFTFHKVSVFSFVYFQEKDTEYQLLFHRLSGVTLRVDVDFHLLPFCHSESRGNLKGRNLYTL